MKIINVLFIFIILLFSGCQEDSLSSDSVIDNTSTVPETALDRWIYNSITKPYGISVEYRWDNTNVPSDSYSYPPKLEKVKEVLQAIKFLWLETYELSQLGGEGYLKGKTPMVIRMYGGRNVDGLGVELLDNPTTSGAEMHIYNVDDFDAKNFDKVFLLMRSVHHQFAKRLIEVIPYDRDKFMLISERKYTGSTEKISKINFESSVAMFRLSNYANKQGFYTVHSTISAEDDFAEIISATLTHTPKEVSVAEYNAKTPYTDHGSDPQVQEMYNQQAKQSYSEFMSKKEMVETYFSKKLKINLTRLQLASIERMNLYVNIQTN